MIFLILFDRILLKILCRIFQMVLVVSGKGCWIYVGRFAVAQRGLVCLVNSYGFFYKLVCYFKKKKIIKNMCFLNLKLMFLTTHFITFALTFSTNISWTLYLLSNQPKQTCCRWDRCLFWLSLCQIKKQEEHLQVVARGTQSQTVNFLNVIALVLNMFVSEP